MKQHLLRVVLCVVSIGIITTTGHPQGASRIALAHGALSSGGVWNTLLPGLQSDHPSISIVAPSIAQTGSLTSQASSLQGFLLGSANVLVGHSNGGLLARKVRTVAPSSVKGIVTLDSPNGGMPLANRAQHAAGEVIFISSAVNALTVLPVLNAYFEHTTYPWTVAAYAIEAGGWAYSWWMWTKSQLEAYAPFINDDKPGSAFLGGLGAPGPNSYALSGTVHPDDEASGFWILLNSSANAATNAFWTEVGGASLLLYSDLLQYDIDWSQPDAWLAMNQLVSAQYLGNLTLNHAIIWCNEVSYPAYCLPNDAFVPAANQVLTGATNEAFTVSSHNRMLGDATVLTYARARISLIVGVP